MSAELKKYPIVNEAGEFRVVSRKITAWKLFLSLLAPSILLGGVGGLMITPENTDMLIYCCCLSTTVVFAVFWFPFGRHWFWYYYKGILISGKHDRLIAPCFKHDCIWDKFRNYVWPKRHSVALSEIERLYNSKRRVRQKTSDGKTKSHTVFELNVAGDFGALTMNFRERNKRDETRNAIRSVLKACSIKVSESTDAFN